MNIFKIHFLTYLLIFIVLFNGYFNKFFILMFIILFHELGHILASLLFKWKISKIIILPFGCLTVFDEKINRPLNQELIITLGGPIFHIITMFIVKDEIIFEYSKILLIFNLLPIYPLDGAKILNIFLNKIISFKKSHIITMYISFIVFFLIKKNLIMIIIIMLLLNKIIEEIINHKYIFYKFLYERHLYKFKFKKIKKVKSIKQFKKDYRHLIRQNDNYVTEKEYLNNIFKKP